MPARGHKPLYKAKRENLIPKFDALRDGLSVANEVEEDDEEVTGEEAVAALNRVEKPLSHWAIKRANAPPSSPAPSQLRDWTNTPASELPPSKQPNNCATCGVLCSPSSMRCLSCWEKERDTGVWKHPNLGKRTPCIGRIVPDPRPASELLEIRDPNFYFWRFKRWKPQEESILATLLKANAEPEKVSNVLGRDPKAIANRAKDRGLSLPAQWRALIPGSFAIYQPRPKVLPLMQFPYVAKARPGNADLLRVNQLVPRAFSEEMRADIVQEVMLALFEGTVTMEDLERNRDKLTFFIKKFRKMQQPYQEVTGMGGADDERSYEDIAAAMKYEASENESREKRKLFESSLFRHWQDPTQIEAVYARQVGHAHWKLHRGGKLVTVHEAAEELEKGNVSVWS